MSKKKKVSASASTEHSSEGGSPSAAKVNFLSEQAEPRAGRSPIPMFLIVLVGVLAFASDMHLMANRGGFDPTIYTPYANSDDLASDNPIDPVVEMRRKGKQLYEKNCGGCHQANGMGLSGQFPQLAGSDWVTAEGPNRIIQIVLNGLQGPLSINGVPFSAPVAMPAVGAGLSDEEVAPILTYIRSEWGNKASAVTPEMVKAHRAEAAKRGGEAWKPDDLLKVPVK